jgi:hypothetical protein
MGKTTIRGASQIGDAEFLKAFNNESLSNEAVLEELRTDWTAVGVKLRSVRLGLHTTVTREGGKKGSPVKKDALPLEAQIWVKREEIQPQQGVYVSLADRIKSGAITVDADLNIQAAGGQTSGKQTTALSSVPQLPTEPEFSFVANIFGTEYGISGAGKDAAYQALFEKLRELNFSKVMITSASNGSVIGIGDIQNGGSYRFTKQLTAA